MKLYIGCSIWRTEEHAYSESMRYLWSFLKDEGIDFYDGSVVGDAAVDRARSMIMSDFLRSDCDVLVTIDSDIFFAARHVLQLARHAEQHGVAGALYMTRKLNTQPAMLLPEDSSIIFDDAAQPVEVPFLAAGFMAIAKEVVQSISETLPLCHAGWNDNGKDTSFWPFYMPMTIPWPDEGNIYLSEDFAFCHRAKGQGYRLWLDPSIRLGHVGSYMYTMEDLLRPPKVGARPLQLRREGANLHTNVLDAVPQER